MSYGHMNQGKQCSHSIAVTVMRLCCTVVAKNPVLLTKYKKEIQKDGSRKRKCVNTLKCELMLVFVSLTSLLFLILQCCAKFLYENRQNFIQRVHHSSLQPFGNGGPSVMKSKLL